MSVVTVVCEKEMSYAEYLKALPVIKKRGWSVRAYEKGFYQPLKKGKNEIRSVE